MPTKQTTCPVNSHNEWDPLEEVIVGRLEFAIFPAWDMINMFTMPPGEWDSYAVHVAGKAGNPYKLAIVQAAQKDLNEFLHILESEGVTTRRPDLVQHYTQPFSTPAWRVDNGFCSANPRDVFLVIGNEIIETPMADRARYFESWAYRSLLIEYFKAGARWTAAPKPMLTEACYDLNYQQKPSLNGKTRYVITETEPTFDAADFVRCGRDIFGQRSHVTNQLGIEWLQHHLGEAYRVHTIDNLSPYAIHIDTTFMPLGPGKVLVSPEYVDLNALPEVLKTWDILVAPEPIPYQNKPLGLSDWISINTLMLDEKRIIVEKRQEPLIKCLKDWGFEPIPCSFEGYYPFLGGFHCATLDVRRRGGLQSYF
jgi:glycine amidinotransferase